MNKKEDKVKKDVDEDDQSGFYIVIAFIISLLIGLAVAGYVLFTMTT